MSCSVCLTICLFVYLTDYQSIYLSIRSSVCLPPVCLSICLPPAAAFHPYCPQGFGNNFRRKYTQSRVICQSVVVKVASHVCKSGPSAPVVLLIELHGCRSGPFAPVAFHGCCPRTAAMARSAQGASQFAACYAAVRHTRHSDVRPVHLTKTR